jgi:periplasmic protein TonB
MKSIHISKMERLRSINLRIGFAAAILVSIFAFNWTTKRETAPAYLEESYPTELRLKPFTINEPRPQAMPLSTVLRPNDLIIEVPDLAVGLLPTTIPFDSSSAVPMEPGNVQQAKKPFSPTPLPEEEVDPNIPFILVEDMPVFPGCNDDLLSKEEKKECTSNKLLAFLYSKIKYPEIARQNEIEGTVYIKFVIEKDGSVSTATILRDIGGGCGDEAVRVVNAMPKWTPGKQRGRPVRVQFNLPIKFKLN